MANVKDYLSDDINKGNIVALSRTGFNNDVKEHYVNQNKCHLYQIRYNSVDGQPIAITNIATDNWYCDVIMTTPIDFGKLNYAVLSPTDIALLKRYFN